jgi:hypothetical protein
MIQECAIPDEHTIDIKQKRFARHRFLDTLLFNTPDITDTSGSSGEKLPDSRNNSWMTFCKGGHIYLESSNALYPDGLGNLLRP